MPVETLVAVALGVLVSVVALLAIAAGVFSILTWKKVLEDRWGDD